MLRLRKSIRNLEGFRRKWQGLMQAAAKARPHAPGAVPKPSRLREVREFGSNPGALRMFTYVPQRLDSSALVVVLHGCTQTAEGYDFGSGWSTLADRYGFALLFPEQQRSNNPNGCFNWFAPGDTRRGQGEALSIRQMVDRMVRDLAIASGRVYVTGLSAGGAMASVMLATYPDVFAGGAIIAGLPYGAAGNVQEAFESMFECPARAPRAWGDRVRAASPYRGPWPKISVWHGGADATVIPANAREIIKQWTDVHGLSQAPTYSETVDGYPRQAWRDAAGKDVIESYALPGMAHGTPLSVGEGDDQCGASGAFLLNVGISSSYHIAKFWGLADRVRAGVQKEEPAPIQQPQLLHLTATQAPAEQHSQAREPAGASLPVDINAIITKALKAAGLMKTS
jgi:poly(hydroxyalkanoate) depolymerase family esterase